MKREKKTMILEIEQIKELMKIKMSKLKWLKSSKKSGCLLTYFFCVSSLPSSWSVRYNTQIKI